MPQHLNTSGFQSLLLPMTGRDGREVALAVVRATFVLDSRGRLVPAERQRPVLLEDLYAGDPGISGPVEECDLALYKPGTDVVVVGEAHAPRGRTSSSIRVGVQLGPLRKEAYVIGDRVWRRLLGIGPLIPTAPKPLRTLPLVWERAFGGVDPRTKGKERERSEPRNPVGRGYVAGWLPAPVAGQPLPNILHPRRHHAAPRHRPEPWNFGPVGRHWWPRRRLAGTYDERWKKERAPLLPEDFDYRFFQCGSSGLVSAKHLVGDEPVRITNMSPEGELRFSLPGLRLGMTVFRPGRPRERCLAGLDTVVLEPGRRQVCLVWRRSFACRRSVNELSRVVSFALTHRAARETLGPPADQPVGEPAWSS